LVGSDSLPRNEGGGVGALDFGLASSADAPGRVNDFETQTRWIY
jgi:hypothetical protein